MLLIVILNQGGPYGDREEIRTSGLDRTSELTTGHSIPGARSQEPGARSQEPGARSQEPGARSQEPGARSQEPGARSQEPGARSQEPGARSQEPGARSQEPGARSQEPGARSQEPAYPMCAHWDLARGTPRPLRTPCRRRPRVSRSRGLVVRRRMVQRVEKNTSLQAPTICPTRDTDPGFELVTPAPPWPPPS